MYKSKLNELCQKREWNFPTYSCVKNGLDHNPVFRGSVVVNGCTFVSKSMFKLSKAAYNDAAEVAFTHFTTVSPREEVPTAADLQNIKTLTLNPDFNTEEEVPTADLDKIKTLKVPTMSSSLDIKTEEDVPTADMQKNKTLKVPTMSADLNTEEAVPTADMHKIKALKVPTMSSGSKFDTEVLTWSKLCLTSEDTTSDHLVDSINEPNLSKSMESYLLCNKVRVYTSVPKMVLPKGCVVLPIANGKWTVVSLESP